jgi:uncharacterized small protein (DUF1192 family)
MTEATPEQVVAFMTNTMKSTPEQQIEWLTTVLAQQLAEIERLKADKAGWEVEGFIDRLTRRDDSNAERLVLEAVSHLRAFSRDCDTLRESNQGLRAEVERLNRYAERLRANAERDANEIERLQRSHDE